MTQAARLMRMHVLLVPIPQILYNDVSPMENHHVAGAFLLLREERYNFLCHVSAKVRRYTVRPARAC